MITHLFKTKSQELQDWMRKRKVFSTHECVAWGVENYFISANRRKQEFVAEGIIRPLTDREKEKAGFKGRDEVYCWVELKEGNLADL